MILCQLLKMLENYHVYIVNKYCAWLLMAIRRDTNQHVLPRMISYRHRGYSGLFSMSIKHEFMQIKWLKDEILATSITCILRNNHNRWMEFDETWQEASPQRHLSSFCFSCRSEIQDCRPGLWFAETFSTSPLKPMNGIQQNLTGSKISTSSTKFVFFRADRKKKQDDRPSLWLAETFSTSPLKPLNGIQRNLWGSKISTSSTKFVFFGPISKNKCPPWPILQKGGILYSGARYVALWASCFYLLLVYFQCCNYTWIYNFLSHLHGLNIKRSHVHKRYLLCCFKIRLYLLDKLLLHLYTTSRSIPFKA